VLITQQSKKEFFNILENEPERSLVVTISPQVRASIAEYYKISTKEVQNYHSFVFIMFLLMFLILDFSKTNNYVQTIWCKISY